MTHHRWPLRAARSLGQDLLTGETSPHAVLDPILRVCQLYPSGLQQVDIGQRAGWRAPWPGGGARIVW